MRLPHLFGPATRPFTFVGCLELREILGRRARDERELMEGLEQIPANSIYYHTHSIFLRHPRIAGGYPNDFANWVASQVGDKALAERLAVVDPYDCASLEELREELVSIVESHIATLQPVPRCVFGDPLFFVQSHVLEVPTGLEARSLQEFRRCLAEADLSAVYLHTLHARVRGEVAGGDFAHWIGQELGLDALAGAIGRINPYLGGLERIRVETLRLIDAELGGERTDMSASELHSIEPYRDIAPKGTVDFLLHLAERVQGRRFLHVNSTSEGGGVAEILNRLVPIMRGLGIKAEWNVIDGDPDFYATTKAFHNALQGKEQVFTDAMLEHYVDVNHANADRLRPAGDLVLIHDPQPAAMIEARPSEGKWVWRCHIDLSTPQRRVWTFLRRFVVRYDAAVFSLPAFAQQLPIPQFLAYPSIDPLADKNRRMSAREVRKTLDRLGVPDDKPILLQVSRFDRFKDPIGVINAYKLVKGYHDVRLVLAGGSATDDPEGAAVLNDVREAAGRDPDIYLLDLPSNAHLAINALQRAATIVIQKSTREGFGLTVAEAMWKGKPVIGGATGGITVQILYGVTGYTVSSVEGCAFRIRYLLSNPQLMRRMGEAGREHVRENFLITRHLRDYLSLLAHLSR